MGDFLIVLGACLFGFLRLEQAIDALRSPLLMELKENPISLHRDHFLVASDSVPPCFVEES
jgi:hypothetical protein